MKKIKDKKRILCHRPMRHGPPAFEVRQVGGKYIVDNYGHGGSGWTLAPGTVGYVIEGRTNSGLKIKRSFYIFPKKLLGSPENDVGVIGGTFIEGADETTLNEEEFEIMLKGAKDFYGIK